MEVIAAVTFVRPYIDRCITAMEKRAVAMSLQPLSIHEYLVLTEIANRGFDANGSLWETSWVLIDAFLMLRNMSWEMD